jgi:hypothetical protein
MGTFGLLALQIFIFIILRIVIMKFDTDDANQFGIFILSAIMYSIGITIGCFLI